MALLTSNFTGVTPFFIFAEFIMLAVISLGVALIIGFSTFAKDLVNTALA